MFLKQITLVGGIPYDMELQRKESKEFLDDLTTRDQRMMVAVLTMVITADTKQRLDADTDDPQEAATVDNNKKALLKEIFWAMNAINSRTETVTTTQTVEADDGEGNIIEEEVEAALTTLYISVSHKTADEMADEYGFTAEQRQMLAELLAEENSGIWNAALYGIGAGDGEIVAVALSQIGNVGGALLVVVRFQLPCGLVRLLCQLVRQRVRVSGRRRDPENGKPRRRLQLV